jgi:hypothetical protein
MAIRRVVLSGTFYAQLWQNRFHVDTDPPTLTDEEVCNHFKVNWVNRIRNLQDNDIKYTSVSSQAVGPGGVSGFTLPLTETGALSPSNQSFTFACWVLQLRTDLVGRRFRGRVYVPGVHLGYHQEGRVNAPGLAAWNLELPVLTERFIQGGEFADIWLVIRGETESHNTVVRNIQLRSVLGMQRRRNIGVGN